MPQPCTISRSPDPQRAHGARRRTRRSMLNQEQRQRGTGRRAALYRLGGPLFEGVAPTKACNAVLQAPVRRQGMNPR